MLPPDLMLTTKKGLSRSGATGGFLAALLLVAGCSPSGPRALLKGERLIREGRPADALPLLEQATQLMATNAQAWNHLGLARHGAGQFVEAGQAYGQALALDRNLAVARYNLGCLFLDQNRPADAIRELTTYVGLSQSESAVESGFLKLAQAQVRLGQYAEAEKSFLQVLRLNPHSAPALNGLGVALVQRGKPQAGMQQFRAALAEQTNYPQALLNAAITAQGPLRDRALALRTYQDYLALNVFQEHRAEVQALATVLESELHPASPSRRVAEPERSVTPAPTVDSTLEARRSEPTRASVERPTPAPTPAPKTSAPAPERKTVATPPVPQTKPAVGGEPKREPKPEPKPAVRKEPVVEARAEPAKTAAVAPPVPAATSPSVPVAAPARAAGSRYAYRNSAPKPGDRVEAVRLLTDGVEAQEAGRTDDALRFYQQATQADPALFEAHYNLGLLAYQEKQTAALPALETALLIQPGSAKARFFFALALDRGGYTRDAVTELQKVVEERPDDARAYFSLGYFYAEKLKDPQAARPYYLKLLELQPQHPEATKIRFWIEQHP